MDRLRTESCDYELFFGYLHASVDIPRNRTRSVQLETKYTEMYSKSRIPSCTPTKSLPTYAVE